MDVAREQRGSDLPLKIVDTPADAVDGQFESFSRGSETSAAHHLQENPGRVPIAETTEADLAFLLRNAPFQHQMHTHPPPLGKLGRIWREPQP